MIRAVRWRTTDPRYQALYLERFGGPSHDWMRREKDEQEARRADTRQ